MSLDKSAATVKQRYHHGDLRRALLELAAGLLEEGGVDAVSVREAARRLGVSPRAPYRHFRDKAALLSALAVDAFQQLSDALSHADGTAEPGQEVEDQAIAYVWFARQAPARFRLMFERRGDAPDGDVARAKKAAFAVSERRVHSTGAPDSDTEARILGHWALAHGLAELFIDAHLSGSLEGDAATLIRRVVRATLSEPGAAPTDKARHP